MILGRPEGGRRIVILRRPITHPKGALPDSYELSTTNRSLLFFLRLMLRLGFDLAFAIT